MPTRPTFFCSCLPGAQVVQIPGRAYPVTPFFLEDVLERTGYVVDPRGDCAFKGSRGGGGARGEEGRRGAKVPSDWACPSCGNNCFASKPACNRQVFKSHPKLMRLTLRAGWCPLPRTGVAPTAQRQRSFSSIGLRVNVLEAHNLFEMKRGILDNAAEAG